MTQDSTFDLVIVGFGAAGAAAAITGARPERASRSWRNSPPKHTGRARRDPDQLS